MSYADKLFIDMCSDIIENGYSTEGEKVRPKWPDGTYAYTIKKFGVVNRYDLSKEFPAITLRNTYIRSAIDEILWIWQKKSNNVHDLSSHISVSYTHLRAHETVLDLVCRLLLEKNFFFNDTATTEIYTV